VKKHIDFDTEGGMDTHVYTYTGYNYEEVVLGIGNAERNNKLGQVGSKFQGNFYF
jgi:hypothetical protein